MPPLTSGRPPQCRFSLGRHAVGLLVPEAERDLLIRIREKNFQARQARHHHWSSRSRGSSSPATDRATARASIEEKESLSTDITIGLVPAEPETKKRGDLQRPHVPRHLYQMCSLKTGTVQTTQF